MANQYWLIMTNSLTSEEFNAIKILGNTSGLSHQKPHWTSLSNNKIIIQADFSVKNIEYLDGLGYARKLGDYESSGKATQSVYDEITNKYWQGNGINYYHESMGYISRNETQINTDLDRIKTKTNRVKIYHNPLNASNLANCKNICERAKAKSMYVVWTENDDNTELNAANWSTYSSAVVSDSAEAEDSGADEFLVGNEISIHNDSSEGFNDTNLPIKVKQLITDCGSSFSGVYGYEDGWWKCSVWATAGLGVVEKIYFTLYEDIANFEDHLDEITSTWGSLAAIGEWSTQDVMGVVAEDDESAWTELLLERQKLLDESGIEHYIFCFRDTGIDSDDQGFGLWRSQVDTAHTVWSFL